MIREYLPADCEDVLNVWAEASAGAHPFLNQEFVELERHRIPTVYLPTAEAWVSEADGHVRGRALCARYGFELKHEDIHDETGLEMMRLRLSR